MAYGRLVIVRESDFSVVGEVESVLLSETGMLAIDLDTGNTVFASMTPGNLVAFDVSDPTAPTVVGAIEENSLLEDPTAIMWNFGYIYVASSTADAISRVPVGDPTTLAIDKTLAYASFANVVDLEPLGGGSGAAACETTNSVVVATIDAVQDELVDNAVFDGLVALQRDVAGLLVYTVATTSQKLGVVDVSDRANILLVGSLANSEFANAVDLAVAGDYVYVVTSTGKIVVIDIADPSTPTLVGVYTNAAGLGTPSGIIEVDGQVYIVDSAGGLVTLNFTSTDLVNYGEYPLEFDGTYNTDSRIHLEITGPATILALTYHVDDTDNPSAQEG